MRRFVIACSCILATSFVGSNSSLSNDGNMISNAAVAPLGLKVQWFSQVDTGVRGRVIDMVLNINEDKSTTFFEIGFGRGREVVSQNDLDAFGKPRGIEGAQEYAELRKEIIEKELKARGIEKPEVTIQKYSLPASSLYALTSDGYVAAIDADTGGIKWTTEISTSRNPAVGIGCNNNYVAAVNGTNVFCMEAETGKVIFSSRCKNSVSAGPGVSDDFVYVPLEIGRVEVFPIITNGLGSQRYMGTGRALSRPLITENSVAWTTTAGHLNVALHKKKDVLGKDNNKETDAAEERSEPPIDDEIKKIKQKLLDDVQIRITVREKIGSVSYRLTTHDKLVSSATSKSGMLFVTTLGGFVYAVDEAKGSIEWEFSTGAEIESPPFLLGNYLYILTSMNSLFKLDAQSGSAAWERPVQGISKFISATKDRLFAVDQRDNLLVLNQESGRRLGEVNISGINMVFANTVSDRLYVGNTNGLVQCLTEINSTIPYFHIADFEKTIAEKPVEDAQEKTMEADVSDDPFRAFDAGGDDKSDDDISDKDNPFGGGTDAQADDENPFGGGDDSGKSDKEPDDENPFGGGDDSGKSDKEPDDENPFGGGGSDGGDDDNPFDDGGI